MKFKDMTVKQLKEEAKGYHETIYKVGCYGAKDLMNYDGIIYELERRGYTVNGNSTLSIYK